ncbi:YjgN family protein [Rhodospirillum sp. A1_3_36]|uniref:YjgN family protein n=1 Tax=Rhodospirillum sp. A1_3_36 TaxID=3391666 RepID=UPI0039A58054
MDGIRVESVERRKKETFLFTGNTKDYFGIWIVNILLTILTLGIWSAWAKVRRLRYFYGNTVILGGSLDYTASPWAILLGRILVVVAFVIVSVVQQFSPLGGIALFTVYLFILPWLVCRSLRFNARNTVWRNVSFNFRGEWGQAFIAYVIFSFVSLISLFILAPMGLRVVARFWADNHDLGTARFSTETKLSDFYKAMGWAVGTFLGILVAWGVLVWTALLASNWEQYGTLYGLSVPIFSQPFFLLLFFLLLIFFPPYLVAKAVFSAHVRNIVVNGLTLEGGHWFRSTLRPGRYVWIVVTNALATSLTLGLAHPWAAVRLWRYSTENLHVLPGQDIEAFVDTQEGAGSAFGSEFFALDAIDLGL